MRTRSALVYSVLRLLAFFVPFGIFMLIPIMREYYWLSAIFAALIGLSLSMIFLRRPLEEVTSSMAERRARADGERSDEEAEDEVVPGSEAASDTDAAQDRPQA